MLQIPSNKQAVFFDLNGTLIRDRVAHKMAFRAVLAEYNLQMTNADFEEKVANQLQSQIWPNLFGKPLTDEEIAALGQAKERCYIKLLPNNADIVPGSRLLIQKIKQHGLRIALVTSAPTSQVNYLLSYLKLEGVFDLIIDGSQVQKSKPDSEAYLLALKGLDINPDQAIAFEDSPRGVAAAVAAGIETIGMQPEYPPESLKAKGASGFIHDFTEVWLAPDLKKESLDFEQNTA